MFPRDRQYNEDGRRSILSGSEAVNDEFDGTESTMSLVQRDCITKAYNIDRSVACQVGNEARVSINAPKTSSVAEIVDE
jgi:hypothetical protein